MLARGQHETQPSDNRRKSCSTLFKLIFINAKTYSELKEWLLSGTFRTRQKDNRVNYQFGELG